MTQHRPLFFLRCLLVADLDSGLGEIFYRRWWKCNTGWSSMAVTKQNMRLVSKSCRREVRCVAADSRAQKCRRLQKAIDWDFVPRFAAIINERKQIKCIHGNYTLRPPTAISICAFSNLSITHKTWMFLLPYRKYAYIIEACGHVWPISLFIWLIYIRRFITFVQ